MLILSQWPSRPHSLWPPISSLIAPPRFSTLSLPSRHTPSLGPVHLLFPLPGVFFLLLSVGLVLTQKALFLPVRISLTTLLHNANNQHPTHTTATAFPISLVTFLFLHDIYHHLIYDILLFMYLFSLNVCLLFISQNINFLRTSMLTVFAHCYISST